MIDELSRLVENFPGESMRVRCFAHVINLVVKSILKQFDLPDKIKDEVLNEGLKELQALGADLELEEQILRDDDADKNDDDDDIEGWVDEREEMSEEDLEELEETVLPVRKVLVKVSVWGLRVTRPPSFVDLIM